MIDNNSNTSSRCSSDSSFDSIINDSNVLDKYGIIDIRGKLDNYGNYFLSQPHANKSTKHHVITINSGKLNKISDKKWILRFKIIACRR